MCFCRWAALPQPAAACSKYKALFFPSSFHPQIKWFQKDDVVILKIKIRNVKDYKCKFFTDRVIFR
jgi:hypothetical protein